MCLQNIQEACKFRYSKKIIIKGLNLGNLISHAVFRERKSHKSGEPMLLICDKAGNTKRDRINTKAIH